MTLTTPLPYALLRTVPGLQYGEVVSLHSYPEAAIAAGQEAYGTIKHHDLLLTVREMVYATQVGDKVRFPHLRGWFVPKPS